MKSLKDSFILIFIILELILNISCKPVSDYKEVIEYLQNFDYLTQDEKFSLNKIIDNNESVKTDRRFKRALENLQKNGNIPITGKYDKNTALLIDTPRCGVSDKNIIGTRHKRYTLMSTKWPKTNLTWRFDHKNKEAFAKEENNIRRIIAEAFEVWEKDTIMKFTEAKEGEADIVISFEHPKHTQIDPYVFGSQTLGHAFQPGRGLGGDAHFNERIKWDFSVKYDSKPEDGKISFFAVALHELGHSLGLGHTREEDAVMYEFYSKSTSTLAEDDIRGMQHIYGVPPNRKYKPNNNKAKEDDTPPVWGQAPARPDKCNTSYDAIATIDGEVVAFRRKYMFGPNMEVTEIKSRWRGLPSNLSRVDAVFQTSDKRVLFFINQDVYVFNGKILQSYKLTDFGMDQSVSRINAILRKSDNNQIYIFFGNSYLKFDEHKLKVFGIQTRITKAFRDVFEFDTGFTFNGKTYFIINEKSYEFDNENWILRRMKPELSANVFMNCNIVDLGDRFSDSVTDDFIDDEKSEFLPEAPNCHNNPEIPCNDQDNGTVKEKIRISLVVSYTVIGLMNFI